MCIKLIIGLLAAAIMFCTSGIASTNTVFPANYHCQSMTTRYVEL